MGSLTQLSNSIKFVFFALPVFSLGGNKCVQCEGRGRLQSPTGMKNFKNQANQTTVS